MLSILWINAVSHRFCSLCINTCSGFDVNNDVNLQISLIFVRPFHPKNTKAKIRLLKQDITIWKTRRSPTLIQLVWNANISLVTEKIFLRPWVQGDWHTIQNVEVSFLRGWTVANEQIRVQMGWRLLALIGTCQTGDRWQLIVDGHLEASRRVVAESQLHFQPENDPENTWIVEYV